MLGHQFFIASFLASKKNLQNSKKKSWSRYNYRLSWYINSEKNFFLLGNLFKRKESWQFWLCQMLIVTLHYITCAGHTNLPSHLSFFLTTHNCCKGKMTIVNLLGAYEMVSIHLGSTARLDYCYNIVHVLYLTHRITYRYERVVVT